MQTADLLSFPGFVDVHVHFRDPGAPEAETTASGLAAARRGGFAAVVTMPNTDPACDSPEGIDYQRRAARAAGSETVLLPSACITKGRLGREVADLEALAGAGAAFFTDDGSYVADDAVMEEAMRRAAKLGMCVCQHAMDPKETGRGVVRDCAFARRRRSAATSRSAASRDAGSTSSTSPPRRAWRSSGRRSGRGFPSRPRRRPTTCCSRATRSPATTRTTRWPRRSAPPRTARSCAAR